MVTAVGASCDIAADRATVWSVLVDVARYPEWNPFTVSVATTFELGTPVDMQVRLGPFTRHQVEYVSRYDEGRELCWAVTMGAPWLLTADRYQRLADLPDGGTRYTTADVFTGVGVPVVMALTGLMMRTGFAGVAQALKVRCETLRRPGGAR